MISILAGSAFLIILSALVGWPILSGNGLWYLDNPAHLAETLERAQSGWPGWSDLAFCGFPLGQWHSPLVYGALAGAVRWGAPLAPTYAAALWAAALFPPLVLFFGARRRLGVPRAAFLGSILLLQPPALVGIESAWGGMWTFYLATGGWLWLMQRWSSGRGGIAGDAMLIGAIGLIHLFVLAAVPLLAGVQVVLAIWRPAIAGRSVTAIAGACLLGALASAAFWLPASLAQMDVLWTPQNLPAGRLLWALGTPADLQTLTSAAPIAWREAIQFGLLPMLTLMVLGMIGGFRHDDAPESRPERFGFAVAWTALAVLLLLPFLPAGLDRILGPASWRLLYIVRLGLAWSATAAFASARSSSASASPSTGCWTAAGLLILALGWGIAAPLRRAVQDPGHQAQREVSALWEAVRSTSRPDDSGRIYMQDTYGNPDLPRGLARNSHVLAYTAAATSARQVGAYYGMAPLPTATWTSGEFGLLCGVAPGDPDAIATVWKRLRLAHCSRLVATPLWARMLEQQSGFAKEYQSEWFTLFRIALDTPAQETSPCLGETVVSVSSDNPGDSLLIAQTWHPHLELDAPEGVRLVPDESGLCRVENLPAGNHTLHRRYQPPHWPRWISWGTWIGLFGMQGLRRYSHLV